MIKFTIDQDLNSQCQYFEDAEGQWAYGCEYESGNSGVVTFRLLIMNFTSLKLNTNTNLDSWVAADASDNDEELESFISTYQRKSETRIGNGKS